MAIYNNYEIKPVSEEDSFLFKIVEDTYYTGSTVGFLLGDFYSLIEKIKETGNGKLGNDSEELYDKFQKWFDEYFELRTVICNEWERRGKPKSIQEQKRLKDYYDEQDSIKEEYYDR